MIFFTLFSPNMVYNFFRIIKLILYKLIVNNMRYQKYFVQNKARVLGEILNKISLNNQKHILSKHPITKKDDLQRLFKGKEILYPT